ncbi:MAG: hypothetical protein IJF49_06505 [Clostridia bacterium]|nr:hypothetical protein [Clostridia bacterium]
MNKPLTKGEEYSKIKRLTARAGVAAEAVLCGAKKLSKSFRKALDKGSGMWYNNRVAPREDLRRGEEIGH